MCWVTPGFLIFFRIPVVRSPCYSFCRYSYPCWRCVFLPITHFIMVQAIMYIQLKLYSRKNKNPPLQWAPCLALQGFNAYLGLGDHKTHFNLPDPPLLHAKIMPPDQSPQPLLLYAPVVAGPLTSSSTMEYPKLCIGLKDAKGLSTVRA